MNHWRVDSEEMPEGIVGPGDKIIFSLTVDDLETAYFELWDGSDVEETWPELGEEERDLLFKAAYKASKNIEWLQIFMYAVEEAMNAERDG